MELNKKIEHMLPMHGLLNKDIQHDWVEHTARRQHDQLTMRKYCRTSLHVQCTMILQLFLQRRPFCSIEAFLFRLARCVKSIS